MKDASFGAKWARVLLMETASIEIYDTEEIESNIRRQSNT